MMPFTGGIDKQLEMEMLKGPQQLQREMQTLGPDTIRMIALKRFADQEKANAMQANLQAQPPMATVADQLEQEVRGIASMRGGASPAVQEVARRVGGVNQQKAIQAQKNMQRVAQGPNRPVMAAEGGLMSRPVNNIGDRYFQGGGIVGFANGGYADRLSITEEEFEELGIDLAEFSKLDSEKRSEIIEQLNDIRATERNLARAGMASGAISDLLVSPLRAVKNLYEEARTSDVGKALGLADPLEEASRRPYTEFTRSYTDVIDQPDIDKDIIEGQVAGQQVGEMLDKIPAGRGSTDIDDLIEEVAAGRGLGVDKPRPLTATTTSAPPAPTAASTATTTGAATTPAAGIASVSPTLAPTPTKSGLAALTRRLEDRAAKSPEEAAKARREEAQEALGYTEEEQAQLDAMRKEAKGLETRLLDPKMNRFRAIREALAAGANTGSLGGTGAAVSSAVSAGQDRVANLERELTKERREQAREDLEKSREIRALAYGEGQKEAELTRAEIDSALQGITNIARDENRAAVETTLANANNQTRTTIANLEAEVRQEGNRLQREANDLAREDRKLVGLSNQVTKLVSDEARIRADIVARYALQMDAARNALIAPRSDEEAEKAQAAYDRLNKEMTSEIQKATKNVRAQMDDIRDTMSSIVTSVTKI